MGLFELDLQDGVRRRAMRLGHFFWLCMNPDAVVLLGQVPGLHDGALLARLEHNREQSCLLEVTPGPSSTCAHPMFCRPLVVGPTSGLSSRSASCTAQGMCG